MSSLATALPVNRGVKPVTWGRYALTGLATIAAAVAANVLVYIVSGAIVTYDPAFEILATVLPTISVTAQAGIVAVVLYAALLRFSANPTRAFSLISAVVFIVTLIPDLTYVPGLAGASHAQTAVLVLMHVVAAAVIVPLLTTLAPSRAR